MSPKPTGMSTPRVFICYRREDTAAHAGRLYDAMVARFGERNVFMDVDLAPGVDFVERITKVVSGCLVLIVVMGRNWATEKDEDGEARIADPTDFVRLEVETALRRPEVTPIPVLVSGARMPKPEDLPPELAPITRRNALELSDARWSYDVGRLNGTLDELLADVTRPDTPVATPQPTPPPAPTASPPAWRLLLEGVLVAGVTAYAARKLGGHLFDKPPDPENEHAAAIAAIVLRRAVTWALTGAALAVWLAIRTRRGQFLGLGLTGLLVGALAGALAGAIWAVPFYLLELEGSLPDWIDLGALAVTGGILGTMIGALWRPSRPAAGLASGVLAGVLWQLLVIGGSLDTSSDASAPLGFGLSAIAIAGLTLAVLLALDRRQLDQSPPPESNRQAPDRWPPSGFTS